MNFYPRQYSGQKGFSMVELLLAAFILAIGILGLIMLQTVTLRANGSSRSTTTALRVGGFVLDDIQREGRQLILWSQSQQSALPASTYFDANTAITQFFDYSGQRQNISTENAQTYFTVAIARSEVGTGVAWVGGIKNFQVVVSFKESPNPSNPGVDVLRTMTLNRQVAYGKS